MNFSMSSFISVGDAPTATWIIGCRPNAPRAAAIEVASPATPQVFRWTRALSGSRKKLARKNGFSHGSGEAQWAILPGLARSRDPGKRLLLKDLPASSQFHLDRIH